MYIYLAHISLYFIINFFYKRFVFFFSFWTYGTFSTHIFKSMLSKVIVSFTLWISSHHLCYNFHLFLNDLYEESKIKFQSFVAKNCIQTPTGVKQRSHAEERLTHSCTIASVVHNWTFQMRSEKINSFTRWLYWTIHPEYATQVNWLINLASLSARSPLASLS